MRSIWKTCCGWHTPAHASFRQARVFITSRNPSLNSLIIWFIAFSINSPFRILKKHNVRVKKFRRTEFSKAIQDIKKAARKPPFDLCLYAYLFGASRRWLSLKIYNIEILHGLNNLRVKGKEPCSDR